EAVVLLRKELGWPRTPTNLSMYIKRHGLTVHWQLFRIDPQRVQKLVQDTRSRTEAVAVLQKKLGWTTTPANLSRYIRRHGITASWQGEHGAISIELLALIVVLGLISGDQSILAGPCGHYPDPLDFILVAFI